MWCLQAHGRQDGAGIRSTTEVVGSDGRDVGDLATNCFDACPANVVPRGSLEVAILPARFQRAEPGCAGGQRLTGGQPAALCGKLVAGLGPSLFFLSCFGCWDLTIQARSEKNIEKRSKPDMKIEQCEKVRQNERTKEGHAERKKERKKERKEGREEGRKREELQKELKKEINSSRQKDRIKESRFRHQQKAST